MVGKRTSEECARRSLLSESPKVGELVESKTLTILGEGICGGKLPISVIGIISGTDVTCSGPDSDGCPGFEHTDGS